MSKKKIAFDVLLVLLLLFVGIVSYFIIEWTKEDGERVVVSINGEAVSEYNLKDEGRYEINGGTNILVISNGKAYVEYASCPDGLCINQGKISMTGERIVCLPNKVIIQIE